ncbi:aminoacyl-tRNA hydrolase [candidate division WOR-3 bacterium]|nr:aminoacyl-tRNA hydrolase [candidate division WOR-3 bacterium]
MIIFGLGNPGLKYRWTRHNAGCIFLDRLARHFRKKFVKSPYGSYATHRTRRAEVLLVKPSCWMNQCGDLIHEILTAERSDFLVVLDDINLPLGRMRMRSKGSDGGHRGLRSIIDGVGRNDFPRLRIGVGRPSIDAAEYVLGRFSAAEKRVLRKVIREGIGGIEMLLVDGFEQAQNHINAIKIELDAGG